MAELSAKINQLVSKMLQKRFFVVHLVPLKTMDNMLPILPEHLEYMIGLENRGVLFASGPFLEAEGKLSGEGMMILRASSSEQAMAIAAEDPFHKAGLRNFEVKEWQVNEGRLNVTVNFSNGSYSIE